MLQELIIYTIYSIMPSELVNKNTIIIAININSLISLEKKYFLLKLIKIYNPDIILLSETKLNQKHKLIIDGYNIIRNDRPNSIQGGGTAIIIKKNYKYKIIDNILTKKQTCIESSTILLKLKNNENLYIMSIYASQNNQHNFNKEFEEIFSTLKLDKLENYYIIGGDMNAKHTNWNNKENNSRGISLNDWINYNSITYKSKLHYTDAPTYPRTNASLSITEYILIQLHNKDF